MVNVGGFVASLLTILAIGAVLDLLTPGASTDYGLDAFRAAFAVQYVFWAVGPGRRRSGTGASCARGWPRDGVVLAPLHVAVARPAAGRLGLPLTAAGSTCARRRVAGGQPCRA